MQHRVLLIAHAYPPCHAIGALRAAGFAKYLPQCGWEPIVVTRDWGIESGGMVESEAARVVRTEYRDRLRLFRRPSEEPSGSAPRGGGASYRKPLRAIRKLLSFPIKEALAFPDEFIGWKPYALQVARRVLQQEKVSLLFSTSPPPTGHLIAGALQRETGLPWVADFRDLWTQNHYIRHVFPRTVIEQGMEKRTLRRAGLLVTVSEPLADQLSILHGKPTEVITNGYDEDDYSGDPPPLTPFFSLTYTGQIYTGKRDPSLLFEAVGELVEERAIVPEAFQVRFFGPARDRAIVNELAARYGIQQYVVHGGHVDYQEAILRQRESTALLLLSWHVPEEKGVYTGKVFEYLGAKRPILAIPRVDGVVDELLRRTNAGVAAGTKEEIVRTLAGWYDNFTVEGVLPRVGDEAVVRQFTRRAQTEKLAGVLDRLMIENGMK